MVLTITKSQRNPSFIKRGENKFNLNKLGTCEVWKLCNNGFLHNTALKLHIFYM